MIVYTQEADIINFKYLIKMNPGHQPERFQAFTMIPGTQKFTIKDCDFVFEVDRYGGWFD